MSMVGRTQGNHKPIEGDVSEFLVRLGAPERSMLSGREMQQEGLKGSISNGVPGQGIEVY